MNVNTITAEGLGAGTWEVTAAAYDSAISRYLPSSPSRLRIACEERSDMNLSKITEVSVFLAMLADWDHNVDGDPLSIDSARRFPIPRY